MHSAWKRWAQGSRTQRSSEPGSIALWDNRCALHNPINDYHGHKRVLHRITFAGDAPTSEQATRSAAA